MSPERAAIAAGQAPRISPIGYMRIGARFATLLLAMLACVPGHYLYRAFAYGSPFPRWFLAMASAICGAQVQRIGTALRRDVVFIANHVSWLDILVLAGASGTAFVAKAELAKAPLVGWLASLNHTVYVKREARLSVAEQINSMREALEDNWSVTIFPEGTTTDGQSLLPFKSSMLKILEPPPPGVMVQPVLIDYGAVAEEIGWVGEESGVANAMRILSRRGTFRVRLHFLEPFAPDEHHTRKDISRRAREEIEAELLLALGKPLRDFALDVAPVRYSAPKQGSGDDDPPLDS